MNETDDPVDAFVRVRERLLREADSVSPELRQTPFVGHWNLMDVLAHLVGWDYTNLKAVEELRRGHTPSFYEHYDPGWAAYNQQLVERYSVEDWQVLRASVRQSQEAIVAALRNLTPEELTREYPEPGRRRPVTITGILRAAIRDEREHLEQLRTFVASQPNTNT